ncbi:hypothetical protein [Lebetimonas sp. JH292]|uniref:hypothetical protein n=1 Tax=Lebetimonas sp. JH292 TaxID=990068 RepID=UPI000466B491|nr:hypothetical protein [Lebetimonas sp. JH292]
MAKIDEIKEETKFLKVWLSILIVTVLGMVGWGISNIGKVSNILLILDVVGIIILSFIIMLINFAIIKKIKSLKDL